MFREVTSISFHGDSPKSSTWESVAKLDRLINVDFRILDARLTNVAQLRSLPRLKSVTIGFQLSIDPKTLDEIGAIPGLEMFTASTWLREADLKRIARAKNLTTLSTSVIEGDASLTALADLSQLKSLVLDSHAMFSGVGLKSLAPMLPQLELSACRNLKYLKLENFGTTQAGIAPLKDLKTLETLDLQGSVSDDDSLSHLRGLVNLKNLVIDGSKVTDSGLASLVDLKKLEWLSLGGDELTDKGLDQIRKLQSLKTLWIRKSWKVTPEALASIRQDVPTLTVEVFQMPRLKTITIQTTRKPATTANKPN
jgi:Leucine-rich repeat (LRR) protein